MKDTIKQDLKNIFDRIKRWLITEEEKVNSSHFLYMILKKSGVLLLSTESTITSTDHDLIAMMMSWMLPYSRIALNSSLTELNFQRKAIVIEVIDKYKPDLIWWDFGLGRIQEKYKKEVLAYYFNSAEEWWKEVEILYKMNNIPPGFGVVDYEVGRANKLTYYKWITDTSVDFNAQSTAWGYAKEAGTKSPRILVHNFIDREDKGQLIENYIFIRLGELYSKDQIRFWRTVDKNEVDFVVTETFGAGKAYEIKFSDKGFRQSSYKTFQQVYPTYPLNCISYHSSSNSIPILKI